MLTEIIEFVKGLSSGLGTELGYLNIFLLSSVIVLAHREWKRFKAKVDAVYDRKGGVKKIVEEHDAMFEVHRLWMKEFDYRIRLSESGKYEFSKQDLLGGMVSGLLKQREERERDK